LDNAVKYTPVGGTVTVRAEAVGADARIVVSDTGVGIEPQDVPHIFDRLFRGDRSRSESGLGLGLATVQAVVSAHGGSVSVQSDVGTGSTFVIHLPRAGSITKV
jgi:signal transduction histidine kinase